MQGFQQYADPDASTPHFGYDNKKVRPGCARYVPLCLLACWKAVRDTVLKENAVLKMIIRWCEGAETPAPLCTRKYNSCCAIPLRLPHDGKTEVCFGLTLPLARMGRGSRCWGSP